MASAACHQAEARARSPGIGPRLRTRCARGVERQVVVRSVSQPADLMVQPEDPSAVVLDRCRQDHAVGVGPAGPFPRRCLDGRGRGPVFGLVDENGGVGPLAPEMSCATRTSPPSSPPSPEPSSLKASVVWKDTLLAHVEALGLEDGAQELLADFDIRTAPYRRPAGRRSR